MIEIPVWAAIAVLALAFALGFGTAKRDTARRELNKYLED